MSASDFTFGGLTLTPLPSGAMWCDAESVLCVSDLHLGKSERMARRGGALLPPYETTATLDRLRAEIDRLNPATVICLGDSFDDLAASQSLGETHRNDLSAMMAGRRWIWIEGNHDPGATDFTGEHLHEVRVGAVRFRHIAELTRDDCEVSGHYHPKASVTLRGRRISSACFIMDATRLIMPAFGTYTGGLRVSAPELRQLFTPNATVRLIRAPQHSIPASLCD